MKSFAGNAEDRALMKSYGWQLVTDAYGFAFWIAPRNAGVVSLYPDGTWAGGPDAFERLEDYLEWFASGEPWPPRSARD